MPLLVAPVAFQRVAHPDGEVAMARAAKAAGTVMCLSTLATATPGEVAAAAPGALLSERRGSAAQVLQLCPDRQLRRGPQPLVRAVDRRGMDGQGG